MEYRRLGKLDRTVSVIGLGCEHLDRKPYEQVKETVDAALANGVNILDVFMPGKEIREDIAKALGSRRKDVMIQGHIGSTDINQQYDISRDLPTVKKYFEDLLRIFGGHVEFGMMFFIDSEKDYKNVFETDFATYVERMKKEGYIGNVGFSSHSPERAIKAIETGLPEMLMFSVNPAFDMVPPEEYTIRQLDKGFTPEAFKGIDPQRAKLYKLCEQRQIGITVMKSLCSGKLLSPEHTPFASPMTVPQCIHYALSRPAVSSVLLGCQTAAEVEDAVRYLTLDDAERDYTEVLSSVKNDFRGSCVYCNHCQPCPAEIDIAAVTKYLDIALLDLENVPPSVRSHYSQLPYSGSDCIACGKCEDRCPFGVPIIQNMNEAKRVFGVRA
ncbi:MAG: aldo/keto reductase [Clostridiales bacterium]|nr:aldo/keto reductase [Clostridiales bacterium]